MKNQTKKRKESSSLRILDYMSQIPHEAKEKLFELYKIDFEMFDFKYMQFL